MNLSSKILSSIDLNETIRLYEFPRVGRSKIVVICKDCQTKSSILLKKLQETLKKQNNYMCLSCRMRDKWSDPEFREKKELEIRDPERLENQSILSKNLWRNKDYKDKQDLYKKSDEFKEKASLISIELWKNDKFRKKQSDALKRNIKIRSQITKKLWENPEYRNKIQVFLRSKSFRKTQSELSKTRWENKNYREFITSNSKRFWDNDDYRTRQIKLMRSDEFRQKSSLLFKKKWQEPLYRQQATERSRLLRENPIHVKKHKEACKRKWDDPIYKKKQEDLFKNGKDSSLERISQQILNQLDIRFDRQYPLGPYLFDLFIPSHNLLIECQREYWHSSEKAKSRDASKFTYVDKYFPNLKILYLYERDFLNPGLIKHKLIRELFDGNHDDFLNEFSFSDLEILELSVKDKLPNSYYSAPEEFLQSFHYAGYGRSAKKIYGAFLDEKLIAVCKFSSVIRKEVATSLDKNPSSVLELDRFCIHPNFHKKNFASWFLSRCSKRLKGNYESLVSFADLTFGHTGLIYKVSGWKEVGKSRPSYHYINSDGWVLHKKTLYNHAKRNGKTEKEYADEHDFFKVFGKEKTKFLLDL